MVDHKHNTTSSSDATPQRDPGRDPTRDATPTRSLGEQEVERVAKARERNEKLKKERDAIEKMEMGGSGTAKVTSTDGLGGDVDLRAVQWKSTGPVVLSPDAEDPTTAHLYATAPGKSTITASLMDEFGVTSTLAEVDVMVVQKGASGESKIELSLEPAKPRDQTAKPPIPEPIQPKPGQVGTTAPVNKSDLTPAGSHQQSASSHHARS